MSNNNLKRTKLLLVFLNKSDACDEFSDKNTKQSIQNNGEIIGSLQDLALLTIVTISANVTVKIVN